MSLKSNLLPVIDAIRGIAGSKAFDLRPFTVTVYFISYTGQQTNDGFQKEPRCLTLVNRAPDGTTSPVRVKQVSREDAIASGGLYTNQDFRVGPLTPEYDSILGLKVGGYSNADVNPPADMAGEGPIDRVWVISGPGLPTNACFNLQSEEATSLHRFLILRQNGKTYP